MRVREFFKLSLLVVLAAVLIVGIALAGLLAFIGVTAHKQQTWNLSIGEISEALVEDETAPGEYRFSMQQVLDEDQLWAMLIGQDGEILWGYDLPEDLPERYSLTDVASFSRWYLQDYPVQVWVREDGLLVVGEPKGSTWKYAFSMDREILDLVPYWAGMVFFLALACVVGVSYLLLRLWFRSDQNKRDQARSDWINGISHDIRTPLSVVMGYASQMESDGSLGERQREQAGIIRRQSETIRSLVGDLNLTMRLDYEMQPLRRAPLSPAALIRQTAADFLNGGLDEKYSIEVQIDRSAQSLTLEADQFLLLRALANLVNNCIRHNPDGCAITLGVRSRGKGVRAVGAQPDCQRGGPAPAVSQAAAAAAAAAAGERRPFTGRDGGARDGAQAGRADCPRAQWPRGAAGRGRIFLLRGLACRYNFLAPADVGLCLNARGCAPLHSPRAGAPPRTPAYFLA